MFLLNFVFAHTQILSPPLPYAQLNEGKRVPDIIEVTDWEAP